MTWRPRAVVRLLNIKDEHRSECMPITHTHVSSQDLSHTHNMGMPRGHNSWRSNLICLQFTYINLYTLKLYTVYTLMYYSYVFYTRN